MQDQDTGTAGAKPLKRVMLKISGEALMGPQGFGLHPPTVERIAREVQSVHEMGVEICMVIGGGVSGGQIVGATDDTLIAAPVDFATGQPDDSGQPIQAENVLAGILEQFGVPTEGYFPDTDAFRGFHA